jgi:hypothetical protein
MIDILGPAVTIAGGLVVFGATQLAQRFWLDPATELLKALGRASYATVYYANVYASPGRVREGFALEARKELRKSASEIRADLRGVHSYWAFRLMLQLPPREDVNAIAGYLIALSNASTEDDTREAWKEANELKKLLGLEPT